jgi:hypothetical protein
VTRRRLALGAALLAFLAVSVVLARWLQADGAERAKVLRLLRAQARGDADAMARELERCDPACRRLAARLRRPGEVEIVRYDSATARSFGTTTGPTRVVWRTPRTLTFVQCVTVERSGSPADRRVRLTGLSGPIARQGSC